MSTYHSEAGKGDYRRKEDKKAIEKNWDAIDWSVKVSNSDKKASCVKCPRNENIRCDYCELDLKGTPE